MDDQSTENNLYNLVDELTESTGVSRWERVKKWAVQSYHWKRKVPILVWIRTYELSFFIRDVVAGLTIGLMLLPQALAYAELAGLDAYIGLYASFFGILVYTVFGTSKKCAIGPTAISSALMFDFIQRPIDWPSDKSCHGVSVPQLATVLAFFLGLFHSILGLLQLGPVVSFISPSVVSGFIQAAAFTIPLGQLKKLFGVPSHGETFFTKIHDILTQIFEGNANWFDFAVGMASVIILVGLKKLKEYSQKSEKLKSSNVIWFICTAKAAIVTVLMMIVAVLAESPEKVTNYLEHNCISGHRDKHFPNNCTTMTLTKIRNVDFPSFHVQPFNFNYEFCNSKSGQDWKYDSDPRYPDGFHRSDINFTVKCASHEEPDVWFVSFSDVTEALGAGLIIQPIISYLELISLGKNFAKADHSRVDPTQEMLALGLTNMMNSFVSGVMVVTAGMSRSTVNYQANAATQLSALLTATVIIVALAAIAEIFVYIPSATLGAVIMVSAASLFKSDEWKLYWNSSKQDFFPFLVTFIFALRKSSTGLILGIISHLLLLLGSFKKTIDKNASTADTLTLKGRLTFPAGDVLGESLQNKAQKLTESDILQIDFKSVLSMDTGAALGLVDAIQSILLLPVAPKIRLVNIKADLIERLHIVGLPEEISVQLPRAGVENQNFDEK